jgi:phosphate-selective porin
VAFNAYHCRSVTRLVEERVPVACRGKRRWAVLAVLTAVAGCAQTGSNPDVPQDQWSADRADCTARARDRAEREFALEQQSNRSLNYNLGGRWASDMNRFSGQRRQQQLFENCMTQRGYILVPASD